MPDSEILSGEQARLYTTHLTRWRAEPVLINFGAIVLCRKGAATMRIDFKDWSLHQGAVITLFPGDVLLLNDVTPDFEVEMLRYDKAMLREASLQLEQTVYSSLRADRCRKDRPVVTAIIDSMFALLRVYFKQDDCTCLDQLVLYQLKAFFTGFYDWIYRNRSELPSVQQGGSRRAQELFNRFMEAVEEGYRQSRDVVWYARRLSITPKYLNTIVRRITGRTAKTIIDHYTILQLKLQLRTSALSIKQLAWDFHFSDTSFFCRYFKHHTGVTPQQFRHDTAEQPLEIE